ncbi:hypothetical protein [Longimicrobium terrae]|uniref:Uncharacterized protein n=1 Tax=Longimicrobium terrae TaxID=1639882 RepID=A0A841H5P1_9BACT|nr:hypothetical protein [Longimicrobium terrae]MBB4639013.1 hypothetical protein [Longimicrobium terrae]MBB6073252.1 hypothetical protein [Longimicrobium terrae]NNC32297.1 hypothetical protein [Longimicrobium terrae]
MSDTPAHAAEEADVRGSGPEIPLRWRTTYGAPPPRPIRLQIPGWAGQSTERGDGAPAMPWHCQPFVEGATYGLELVYPYRNGCTVRSEEGKVRFEGPLKDEMEEAGLPHPFGQFAAGHYGMATALDLLPPPGYALRLGPHPRYFTERGGDVPLALPGHLQRFWPPMFFAVFRAPAPGEAHVFRPGEPYAQLLLVPVGASYSVELMEPEEAEDRNTQARQVNDLTYFLAKRLWQSDTGHWFNDKYKQLLRIFRRGGRDAVRAHLNMLDRFAAPRSKE